jgi:hypothetical protein
MKRLLLIIFFILIIFNVHSDDNVKIEINEDTIVNLVKQLSQQVDFNGYPIWRNRIVFKINDTIIENLSKDFFKNDFLTNNIEISEDELLNIQNFIGLIAYWPDSFAETEIDLLNILEKLRK